MRSRSRPKRRSIASAIADRPRGAIMKATCLTAERYNRVGQRFQVDDALTIAGVPRGGTTWLAELIGSAPGTTTLWEPLRLGAIKNTSDLGFAWRQHVPEDAQWTEAEEFFAKLFSGQCLSPALLPSVGPRQLLRTRRWLLKFCRLNRLLPWLTKRFRLRPPILLVRHPCAVVASQLRFGAWDHVPPRFRVPDGPYREVYTQWADVLASLRSREEVLAATWCLDHWFVLRHPRHDQSWIACSYEALVLDPRRELARLATRLGITIPERTFESSDRPSRTTQEGSPILAGKRKEQLAGWRRTLEPEQIRRVLRTVERFELSDVYTDALEPSYERIAPSYRD